MTAPRRTGGGSATAAGALFQSAASAWYCVGILAERAFPAPLGLPADTTLDAIRCETDEPVDDLLVFTSTKGLIFAQAKHSLSLELGEESDFASAIDQCVRQYVANRANSLPQRTWNRPLTPATDRLVIIVGEESSGPVKHGLPTLLANVSALTTRTPSDAAHSADQERILGVVRVHASRSWREAIGTDPSDDELIAFLQLLRIQTLDLRADGAEERAARSALRTSVLRDQTADSAAWGLLARHCEDLASTRRGADRHSLQQLFLEKQIDVRAPASYVADIERLKAQTTTALRLLRGLAVLRIGTSEFNIDRRCTAELAQASGLGSVVVTGDPGSGKSGVLYWLENRCRAEGTDCVVLLADRIAATSLSELGTALGLEHPIDEVMQNWPGLKPAVLLVDALDAAREDSAAQTIRDLIQLTIQSQSRWNVVATIRKFDLRYSEELKTLFAGAPPSKEFAGAEFKSLRHLDVPDLDDDELNQIAQRSPDLGNLLAQAPTALKDLLRNAFNIRLAADLLTSGVAIAEFAAIRTQLELLERYWRHRVLSGSGADDRETLLAAASEQMVAQRSLRVERRSIQTGGAALEALLSRNVLVEWQASDDSRPDRYILSYAHHVLHDFAIARLLLRGDAHRLTRRLASDGDFALVARPSISMHFHHLWANTRPEFWQLSFDVLELAGAPKILQLVGPSVAAESFSRADDLDPLCERLVADTPGAAPLFLTHLVGAVFTLAAPLVGPDAMPWWPFLIKLTQSLTAAVAFPLQALVGLAVDSSGIATSEQLASLGTVARALTAFALSSSQDVNSMLWVGVQGLCRALRVFPTGAVDLKTFIDPARIQERGYIEVPWLAHEIKHVIDADPELALEIYRAAFEHDEPSTEPTAMSKSRILALASNRRQDFGMALWELGEKYRDFIEVAPRQATFALSSVLESYVRRQHRGSHEGKAVILFRGNTVELRDDGSGVWDAGRVYSDDDGVKILDAFDAHVTRLSESNELAKLDELLTLIAAHESTAVIWRRLLLIASRPGAEALVSLVAPLLENSAILLGDDTGYAAGEFLRVRANSIDQDQRGRIEDALFSSFDSAKDREYATYKRAKILGCLPEDAIVRDATHALIAELKKVGKIPANEEPSFEMHSTPYTEESHLRYLGVPTDSPHVGALVALYAPLREFSSKFTNEAPPEDAVRQVFPDIVAVHEALTTDVHDPSLEKLFDHAWGYLASACAALAKGRKVNCASDIGKRAFNVLLEGARNRQPEFSQAAEDQFNQHPSWGSPAARIDAAKGLMLLGVHKDCVTDELRDALRTLTADPVAAVRFQISTTLVAFYQTDIELFWELARRFAVSEDNRGVLVGFVNSTLGQVVSAHLDESIDLLLSIRRRVPLDSADRSELRRSIDSIVAQAYVYRDHATSHNHIQAMIDDVATYAGALAATLHYLRTWLVHGDDGPRDSRVRRRTILLFIEMLRRSHARLADFEQLTTPFDSWPESERESVKRLNELVRGISDQAYFASGAFEQKKQKHGDGSDEAEEKAAARTKRFYREASELFDELTTVKIAAASHHLIEMLAFFVPVDPRGVFLRIAKSVQSARLGGYQHESLAAKQVVLIVERYIAEYRALFREDVCRRALVEMLDTFVDAGWPSARKLVYQLDEIFR